MLKTFVGLLIVALITYRNQRLERRTKMTKYEFTLILKGKLELTDEISDELFEAGCDDGTPGISNGVLSIDFHREGSSMETAIRSAIANVRSAGYEVERAEIAAEAIPQPV